MMVMSDSAKPTKTYEKYPINLHIPDTDFTSISSIQGKWNFAMT